MTSKRNKFLTLLLLCLTNWIFPSPLLAGLNRLSVEGERISLNGRDIKLLGLRCSNALISDQATGDLIASLDLYRSYGVNTVSVFMMGSRYGDIQGYLPDGTLNPLYQTRMRRILQATDERDMVLIVGCLYWSTSRAKEKLSHWTQVEANRAIANTAQWLRDENFTHVILDPDNEGMAVRETDWQVQGMIAAAKEANPSLVVANNTRQSPTNEDLNMHFGEKEAGKPWFDSESTPKIGIEGFGYWGKYSKETHQENESFYNYSRIGRYTQEMKADQIAKTVEGMTQHNGILLASTWLQCSPNEGGEGPFASLGGRSELGSAEDVASAWNKDIDTIHPDAGILWWMEYVKENYGVYGGMGYFEERDGLLVLEAESYMGNIARTPTNGSQEQEHAWTLESSIKGYSGSGYLGNLPDEQCDLCPTHHSPRDGSGAEMFYQVKMNTEGIYKVWIRGRSTSGESNGVHVQVDGTFVKNSAGTNISGFRPHHSWVWERKHKEEAAAPDLFLSKGMHTIHIYGRDDGFIIDKIVLGHGQGEAPKGLGPGESSFHRL